MSNEISRRDFIKLVTAGTGVVMLTSQGLLIPQGIAAAQDVALPGTFPREQTLIARMLTGRVGSPDNFNEWVGWKWRDRGMQNLGNEPLWSVDFATGNIINGLASGDPVYSEDFMTVTIPLREGVAWSDGQPFSAADVVFTIETLIKYEGLNGHEVLVENVASVSAVDDYTVEFKLNQANSRFHTTFLDRWGCTWIMPKHIFEKEADPVLFTFNPFVGCGPYKLHSFDPQGSWTAWEKREDWDKSPTGILYGEPQPQYIIFQYFADEGDLDAARELVASTNNAELFVYSGDQHYFADSTLPSYRPEAAELLMSRVLEFLDANG